MIRRVLAAALLLALPACGPDWTDRALGRGRYAPPAQAPRRSPENDRLGAQPYRPPPPRPAEPPPPQRGLRVTTAVDEFTGAQTHELELPLELATVTNDGRPVRGSRLDSFHAIGRTGYQTVLVMIRVGASDWQYLRCHSVHGLADESRITPTDVDHDGRVLRRGVSETVSMRIALADLEAMAGAQRVRFRVCNTIYEFPAQFPAASGELYRRLVVSNREVDGSTAEPQK